MLWLPSSNNIDGFIGLFTLLYVNDAPAKAVGEREFLTLFSYPVLFLLHVSLWLSLFGSYFLSLKRAECLLGGCLSHLTYHPVI